MKKMHQFIASGKDHRGLLFSCSCGIYGKTFKQAMAIQKKAACKN